jgi:hypothetical protein
MEALQPWAKARKKLKPTVIDETLFNAGRLVDMPPVSISDIRARA